MEEEGPECAIVVAVRAGCRASVAVADLRIGWRDRFVAVDVVECYNVSGVQARCGG